jgi:hypothetical protein
MPSDRSRSTDRTRYGYTGAVAQQGRVVLDRDFNAQQGLTADRIAADALDFVGPCGTPDGGFLISPTGGSPPPPPFWNPPVSVPASPPETPGGGGDFLIAPGTMYLGGERVSWPGEQNGRPITYSYFDQPDWPVPAAPPPRNPNLPRELVYLEVTELEVSGVEDPDLLEVALGGPDTTQRLKLLRRVRRMPVSATDCAPAWQAAVDQWAAQGWQFDPETMRLLPQVRLQVGFTEPASENNLCDPVATGGYLGNDNQMIRLRIAGSGSGTQLIWGYDNASFLYRVTSVSTDFTTLTLAADPPDGFHIPQIGQLVEVLRTGAVLGKVPDETDPFGQAQILRVAANVHGSLRQLKQPYGPVPGGTGNAIVLTEALPSDINASGLPLFVRVWQAAQVIDPGGGTYALQATVTDPNTGVTSTVINTGLTVTVSDPKGVTLADGAFWQIAVRPSTPQEVYPEDLLTAPQPADGLRRWVCPLAVIDWSVDGPPAVTDCRNCFDNLVTLSRRKPGCCTVAIGPGDVTAAMPLQTLIDRAATAGTAMGQPATVCLYPGNYVLPASLYLDRGHDSLILESCGGTAILSADPKADPALFSDGLVVVIGALGVTLRGLTLYPPEVAVPEQLFSALEERLRAGGFGGAAQLLRAPFASFGVRALDSPELTLEGCTIQFGRSQTAARTDLFGASVFLQGDCSGLAVRGCTFGSDIAPSYTPVVADADTAAPATLRILNTAISRLTATVSLSSPPSAPAATLDTRISAALDVLIATREAGAFAVGPATVVATVGILALDYHTASSAEVTSLACLLGAASVRDTEFIGLTFATWMSATASTLRLQDNIVIGGVAGLWLEVPGAGKPEMNPGDRTDQFYPAVQEFEEFLILFVLAAVFSPPRERSSIGVLRPRTAIGRVAEIIFQPGPPDFALFVLGNQIETRPAGGATAALFLSLNEPNHWDVPGAVLSVVVSANRLRSAAGETAPAALLVLPRQQTCAITGNTILNQATGLQDFIYGPSLWLIVERSQEGTEWLSASGNALRGSSDLAFLVRHVVPARSGWSRYNADQT